MVKICNAICQGSDDYIINGWKRKVDMNRIGKPCPNPAKGGYDKCPKHLRQLNPMVNAWIDSGIFKELINKADRPKKGGNNDLSNR